jgi:hypothetical protein
MTGVFFNYSPSIPGNAIMLAAFAALVPILFVLGYKHKTPMFASILTTGLMLEVLSFIGRVLLHGNVGDTTYHALFLVGSILGPTFIAYALFLILPHIFSIYGERTWWVSPRHIFLFFTTLAGLAGLIEIVGVIFVVFGFNGLEVNIS